jgi:hypothetical protein
LDALADGGFREIDRATNVGIRFPTIGLQLFDDRLGDVIERNCARSICHNPILVPIVTKIKRFRSDLSKTVSKFVVFALETFAITR